MDKKVIINYIYNILYQVAKNVLSIVIVPYVLGTLGESVLGISDFASNIGWDGIMIATIAMNEPIAVGVVGILWAAIKSGSLYMEAVTDTNRLTVEIIQSVFVLFVTINYFSLLHNRFKKVRSTKKEDEPNAA